MDWAEGAFVLMVGTLEARRNHWFACRACRFTLFPSLIEAGGLPVVESLAAGKPCLATGQGAIAQAGAGFTRMT